MPSADPRLGHRARRRLTAVLKREHRPWCQRPDCLHPGEPIDYTAPFGTPLAFEVDEILPRYLGGDPLNYSNLRAAHAHCNRAAGAAITNANRRRGRGRPLDADDW
jgi:5-methylcytosine-specific restriction endonuclease McrA